MNKTITLIFLACFLSLQIFAQADKTLVKSIDLNGNYAVAAVLNGNVTVTEWDKDFARVTTRIELSNSGSSILERLVAVGRYEITDLEKDGELVLTMPKAAKPVNLKGTTLVEKYTFEITVPKDVGVRVESPAAEGI